MPELDAAVRERGELAEPLAPAAFRALLRRARAFVAAPRREDYGIAALEALADGCMLVTTPSPGPTRRSSWPASSTRGWSATTWRRAIRIALDDPAAGYAERAARSCSRRSPARPWIDAVS